MYIVVKSCLEVAAVVGFSDIVGRVVNGRTGRSRAVWAVVFMDSVR